MIDGDAVFRFFPRNFRAIPQMIERGQLLIEHALEQISPAPAA
jgi:hypothetical protein